MSDQSRNYWRAATGVMPLPGSASQLGDLTMPPSNRLQKLKGGEPHEVRIVDYH